MPEVHVLTYGQQESLGAQARLLFVSWLCAAVNVGWPPQGALLAELEVMSFHVSGMRALGEWSQGLHNGATDDELEQMRQLTLKVMHGGA